MSSRTYLPKASKNHKKWYNISCESVPKWCKIKVWRGSGQLLGGSGGLLGISWLQGTSVPLPWRLLGSFSAVLEASWAPLGRLLGRLGHQVGAPWGQIGAFCSDFYVPSPFLCLTSDFDRFRDRFWSLSDPFCEGRKPSKPASV